jgi:LTXXQ motif family protein
MRTLRRLMLIGGMAMATTAFPALAEEGQAPAPTEDHGGHHEGADQPGAQQAPGGGMMGQGGMMGGGMMGQGQGEDGMMGQGQGKGGMMGGGMGGMMDGCPMMGGMMGKGMRGKDHGMMMHSRPMMEGRLAYIKADLEITDAQASAWTAYADAVRARHKSMEDMHADMMKAKESGSAVERLDARIKAMESMVDSLKALKPATEALYAVLTDEQKKRADQLLGGGCGMM